MLHITEFLHDWRKHSGKVYACDEPEAEPECDWCGELGHTEDECPERGKEA
jgi:hypothetical protein